MADDEKDIEDLELRQTETKEYFESTLELDKWKIEPSAKIRWDDINKDTVFGNLTEGELYSILINEDVIAGITAMASMIKNMPMGKKVSNYYFPPELIDSILRKKFSLLTLSNSKDGFLRKLDKTRVVVKGYEELSKKTSPKPKGGFNFLRKKEETKEDELR